MENDEVLIELASGITKMSYGEDEMFDVHGKLFPTRSMLSLNGIQKVIW